MFTGLQISDWWSAVAVAILNKVVTALVCMLGTGLTKAGGSATVSTAQLQECILAANRRHNELTEVLTEALGNGVIQLGLHC